MMIIIETRQMCFFHEVIFYDFSLHFSTSLKLGPRSGRIHRKPQKKERTGGG